MQLLHGVTVLGRPLDGQLDRALAGLAPNDRALARALVGGALRHLPGLDRLIDGACARPLPADARARHALRVALAGRLLLDTPPHAVIATILPLLEGGPRRLVHGVLSSLFRAEAQLPPPALPAAWEARWTDAWGPDEAAAAALRLAEIPPTDLCLADPAGTADWTRRLGGTSLAPGHVRLPGSQAVEALTKSAIPIRASYVRMIIAELERLYNHIGDVGNMCAGVGFAFGANHGARQKETLLRLNEELAGNRFLRGMIVPGGIAWDITGDLVRQLSSVIKSIE